MMHSLILFLLKTNDLSKPLVETKESYVLKSNTSRDILTLFKG